MRWFLSPPDNRDGEKLVGTVGLFLLFLLFNHRQMKLNIRSVVFVLVLVLLATACKFFFGPDLAFSGFSPVIAMALFSGFVLRGKDSSFFLPLIALFVSDLIIHILYINDLFAYAGFYSGQWKNYLILLFATMIGWLLKGRSTGSLIAGGFASPTLYFLVSNFMVWSASTEAVYAKSLSGLMICYEAGLPFYRNSLLAMLVFLPLIMISYNYITREKAILKLA